MEKNPAQTAPDTAQAAEEPAAETPKEPTAEEKLQAQLDELNDRYLRTLAEYDNYRKRTAKEKEGHLPGGQGQHAGLDPADSGQSGAGAGSAPAPMRSSKRGLELIHKSFDEVLRSTASRPSARWATSSIRVCMRLWPMWTTRPPVRTASLRCVQKGYKMGDRILRYAMVKVAN